MLRFTGCGWFSSNGSLVFILFSFCSFWAFAAKLCSYFGVAGEEVISIADSLAMALMCVPALRSVSLLAFSIRSTASAASPVVILYPNVIVCFCGLLVRVVPWFGFIVTWAVMIWLTIVSNVIPGWWSTIS